MVGQVLSGRPGSVSEVLTGDGGRHSSGVCAAIDGHDLVRDVGVSQDGEGEIGDLVGLAETLEGHLWAQLIWVAGEQAGVGDERRARAR
jgi:hypothetical protein